MKTMTDVVASKMAKCWKIIEQHPHLAAHVISGIPKGVATALRRKMLEEKKPEVSIDISELVKVKLTASKKGDSVVFLPSLEILDKGMELIESEELELDIDELTAMSISVMDDEILLDSIIHTMGAEELNDNNVWVSSKGNSGLEWASNTEDPALVALIYFSAIMEALANNKDVTVASVEYDVPLFGVFKISKKKAKWEITVDFAKEFSGACKNEKLAEIFSNMEF